MNTSLKSSFLFIFLYFFVLMAQAQDDRDFRIGIKIIPGIDWTRAKTSDVIKNGTGVGFSFGVMGDFKLSENYFLTPELLVTSMNNNIKLKDSQYMSGNKGHYSNVSYKYNTKFIEIPLLFKYRTNSDKDLNFWWLAGLSPGILIENEVVTSSTPENNGPAFPDNNKYIPNSDDNNYLDFDNHKDNIVKARLGLVLGAGIEYHLSGKTSLYTGLRFNNGFTDILYDGKSKMINNVFGIELGFFF